MSDKNESTLRRLLFFQHPCIAKYGDDGEMQCNACLIDFKRMEPDEISNALHRATMARARTSELKNASDQDALDACKRGVLLTADDRWKRATREVVSSLGRVMDPCGYSQSLEDAAVEVARLRDDLNNARSALTDIAHSISCSEATEDCHSVHVKLARAALGESSDG